MTYQVEVVNQNALQLLKALEQLELIRFVTPRQRGKDRNTQPKPVFGCAKGKFRMADDFDAPIDHFEDYMP